jgi:hypothetical protein
MDKQSQSMQVFAAAQLCKGYACDLAIFFFEQNWPPSPLLPLNRGSAHGLRFRALDSFLPPCQHLVSGEVTAGLSAPRCKGFVSIRGLWLELVGCSCTTEYIARPKHTFTRAGTVAWWEGSRGDLLSLFLRDPPPRFHHDELATQVTTIFHLQMIHRANPSQTRIPYRRSWRWFVLSTPDSGQCMRLRFCDRWSWKELSDSSIRAKCVDRELRSYNRRLLQKTNRGRCKSSITL